MTVLKNRPYCGDSSWDSHRGEVSHTYTLELSIARTPLVRCRISSRRSHRDLFEASSGSVTGTRAELRRAIAEVTQHMLTAQRREQEADGLVSCRVFAEVPPRRINQLAGIGTPSLNDSHSRTWNGFRSNLVRIQFP